MITATLTILEAIQVVLYLDTMQEDEGDPLDMLSETIEEALRAAGLSDEEICDAAGDEKLEQQAVERLLAQIEIQEGAEPEEGSISFAVTEKQEDALLAVAI